MAEPRPRRVDGQQYLGAGRRPDVLRRLSADTEVVAIHEDIGKGNHEFTHAAYARMPTPWVDRLLSGKLGPWMAAGRAGRILAIEAPPQSAP